MIELCTPSQLMPEPPATPLSWMMLSSTTAPEITPSPPWLRSPFMWTPLALLPQTTLRRITGRSPLLPT